MNCILNYTKTATVALNPASFFKLQEQELRELWGMKLLDASLYIFFIARIHGKADWKWSFRVKDFCESWSIGRRTFFRAVSELRRLGLLQWEVNGTVTICYSSDGTVPPATEETVPSTGSAPIPLDIDNDKVTTLSAPVPSVSPPVTTMSPPVTTLSLITPETVDTSESRQSPDSDQIFLKSTDNCAVAGEKGLTEEEEVDKAIESVAEPPSEEVDLTAGGVTEPPQEEEVDLTAGAVTESLMIELPPVTLPAIEEVAEPPIVENPPATLPTLESVTEPPIIDSHPTSLPTQEEAPQVEPTIPQSEIIPPPQLNNDKVIKLNSSPVKKLNIEVELEEEEIENKIEPTTEEVREILQHLRGIGITLNHTIQAIVKKHYASVHGAIAHLKERISQGEKFRNLEGAFVKAVKEGAKPENKKSLGGIPQEINPPSIEQLAALEAAKAAGKIKDYFLSSDGICKVVMPNLHTQLLWWEYLK